MTAKYIASELDLVFGKKSAGDTPEDRARTSPVRFVRSQFQLAVYSEGASGRILAACEALQAFGWSVLRRAAQEGAAPLVVSPKEPATTLRLRREELGLSHYDIATRVDISVRAVETAEKIGGKSPIRTLELLGQALALDERALGIVPNGGRDTGLGVRLRKMVNSPGVAGFTPKTVAQLSEVAWVISRQASLQHLLVADLGEPRIAKPQHDSSYGYPTYEKGYLLASKTRTLLGLGDEEPIESVRKIIEDVFRLPLIQLQMNSKIAGATMANNGVRGIVVNESGMNSNVWVRRTTLCHELGHLLWDPISRLQEVTVDSYADLDVSDRDTGRDATEIRANAFAVAFLAPPSAVKRIARQHSHPTDIVREVMCTFGISATAAKHHVSNLASVDTRAVRPSQLPNPEDNWRAMENLTLDYFPIKATPLSRRGKFSWYVAKAYAMGYITLDSAASWLQAPPVDVTPAALNQIIELG